LDRVELLALYDHDERQATAEPGMRREEAPGVVRLVDLEGTHSAVIYSSLDDGSADAAIRREAAYFAGMRHELEWKLYTHDRPGDLHQRLVEHGFVAGELEAIMALDLAQVSQALLWPVPSAVRRIARPEDLRDVTRVREAVWPGEHGWLEARLAATMRAEPERLSVYVFYEGDEPVSAARIHFPARSAFASLWGGATLPLSRGRGCYTALLAARVQEALRRGVHYLTIDASPMSRPIVAKHGFEILTWSQPHMRGPVAGG
jgi:GNAT superfamily N-acetyltransferase